jgi:hypothetical protein
VNLRASLIRQRDSAGNQHAFTRGSSSQGCLDGPTPALYANVAA